MSERHLKRIIIGAWTILIIFVAAVVWLNTLPITRSLTNPVFLLGYMQRLTALLAFIMMADQIITGTFMPRITEKLGGWFFQYHITLGAITYALIIAHPLLYLINLTYATRSFDPFYIFSDFCVICVTVDQLYISLGRIGFWLAIVAGLAAIFRVKIFQIRAYWKYIHIINYVAFFMIAIHAWFVGSDVSSTAFLYLYILVVGGVILTLLIKAGSIFKNSFKLK